jgi:hypothetical protein
MPSLKKLRLPPQSLERTVDTEMNHFKAITVAFTLLAILASPLISYSAPCCCTRQVTTLAGGVSLLPPCCLAAARLTATSNADHCLSAVMQSESPRRDVTGIVTTWQLPLETLPLPDCCQFRIVPVSVGPPQRAVFSGELETTWSVAVYHRFLQPVALTAHSLLAENCRHETRTGPRRLAILCVWLK